MPGVGSRACAWHQSAMNRPTPSGRTADVSAANEQVDGAGLGRFAPSIAVYRIGVNNVEWIPVDEKAPEIGQRIICTGRRMAVFVGYYRGIEAGFQNRERFCVSQKADSERKIEFIAWMPAPEPYQDRKKYEEFVAIRKAYHSRMLSRSLADSKARKRYCE